MLLVLFQAFFFSSFSFAGRLKRINLSLLPLSLLLLGFVLVLQVPDAVTKYMGSKAYFGRKREGYYQHLFSKEDCK